MMWRILSQTKNTLGFSSDHCSFILKLQSSVIVGVNCRPCGNKRSFPGGREGADSAVTSLSAGVGESR